MRCEISFEELVPTEAQSRQHYVHLDELALSIDQQGLLQNLVVKHRPSDEKYEVIAGERRRRAIGLLILPIEVQVKEYGKPLGNWYGPGNAAERSGSTSGGIPCFVLPASAAEAAHLLENVQREDLWPWELGRQLLLWNEAGYNQEWIAERLSKNQQYVSLYIKLGRCLSKKITEALEKIGDRQLVTRQQLSRLARLYDPVMQEPLHLQQVDEFEKLLGHVRTYTRPEQSKREKDRVHDRAKRLRNMAVPGHAKPYVRAVLEFLFTERQMHKPHFNWK
jgi:ParB-like chromosome segregation protein Spo0J